MAARILPFLRGSAAPVVEIVAEPLLPERAKMPCPVCDSTIALHDGSTCKGCDVVMHESCYWGCVATLDEWRDYLTRWIEPEEYNPDVVPVACPACRKREAV